MNARGVLLPAEHGSWGMIAEPLVIGLVLAPGVAGAGIACLSLALFLLRTPLLRLLRARRAPAPDPHAASVLRFARLTSLAALAGFALALWHGGLAWMLPLALAAPPAFWALWQQDAGRTRRLLPEILATLALASPSAALLIAGGSAFPPALALWGLLALKNICAILHVREQIRRLHGRPVCIGASALTHTAALATVTLLFHDSPQLAAILTAFGFLWLRGAVLTLRPLRSARVLGWSEVAVTALFAALLIHAALPVAHPQTPRPPVGENAP